VSRVARSRPAWAVVLGCAALALASCSGSGSSAPASKHAPAKRVVPAMEISSAPSGGGVRPVLRWKAVAGAKTYRVVVLDAGARPYWAWEGNATSVAVGGGRKPAAKGTGGPRVAAGFSWTVAALDAHAKPLALSDRAPIAP